MSSTFKLWRMIALAKIQDLTWNKKHKVPTRTEGTEYHVGQRA